MAERPNTFAVVHRVPRLRAIFDDEQVLLCLSSRMKFISQGWPGEMGAIIARVAGASAASMAAAVMF